MEKDVIAKIIGELYLNNYVLNERVKSLTDEIGKLKILIGQLSDGQSG